MPNDRHASRTGEPSRSRAYAQRTGRQRAARQGGGPYWLDDLLHTDPKRLMFDRRSVVKFLLGLCAAAGVFKLAQHQIFYHDKNMERLEDRRTLKATLYAKRGTIYDRNGNVLAASVECANIAVRPQLVKKPQKVADALVDVLGVDRSEVLRALASDSTWVYIKRRVDQQDVDKLLDMGLAGIEYEPTIKRIYPYDGMASQVLGVVNVENEGISGLELQYNDMLTGSDGWVLRERAADGSFIAGGAYEKVPASNGTDMLLTLDANIQCVAEDALAKAVEESGARYGSIIATIPATGEILAACSYPTFNVNDLSSARTEDMNLRAVTDVYEPGSVFKALVCGMAIDLGVVDTETTFTVPPRVKAGDDLVSDVDDRDVTMPMTVREIMRRSSNTGMVLVGERIGADNFDAYIHKYHIGERSGIDFPGESTGIVKKRSEYDGGTLGAMSFGQALAVPPVEIMRAISAIANKGVMTTPHFLKAEKGEDVDWTRHETRAISEETAAKVADMMLTVVDEGTGAGGAVKGYEVSGKTGTAQRAAQEGGYQQGSYMASFMGFAPTKDPQVQVYVTLDGTPRSSSAAAKPFATVMQAALSALGVKPTRS